MLPFSVIMVLGKDEWNAKDTRRTMATISDQLAEQGLRIASDNEAGWYVLVTTDTGEIIHVWATEGTL